jgi:uncharacterized protein
MLRKHFNIALISIVFHGFSYAQSSSFVDFFRAVRQDDAGTIRDLLRRGFDPNTVDERGLTGLYIALREGSLKVVDALLQSRRIKVETRTANDESPLMMASLKGHLDIARRLIAAGADVNKPGWTPLHYAATHGHVDIIRLLLEEHAFIDPTSPNGTTPLMMAAHYGTPAAVKLLLDEGAVPTLRNQLGLSAIDFAQQAQRPESAELIAAAVRRARPQGTW